ncbi:MAG: tRNA lysidine(34) synthetase TilS [Balneolaceae bacterium]
MSKFELSHVNNRFRKLKKDHLETLKGPVIAGVSGGPDSMALLYLLHRNRIETIVVHCNYQLRGKSSDLDQELVEKICSLWEIECVSVRLDPELMSKGNFQAWARDERYRILREIKKEEKGSLILTAHHEDDQIETILQKMLRGAGLISWKGMRFIEGDLFRPLLQVSRSEIMNFVQDFNIPYRIDSSNEESTYARNFIRNNWFPELNKLFPGWKENLLRLPDRSEEFRIMTDHLLKAVVNEEDHSLNRSELLNLDETLWPVIIHRYLGEMSDDFDVSRGFLEQMEQLKNLQSGQSIQLSESKSLIRDRNRFLVDDNVVDDDDEGAVDSRLLTQKMATNGVIISNIEFNVETWDGTFVEGVLHLDQKTLNYPLTLRNWRDGDKFRPLGMGGSQLVSDYLTNQKVSSVHKKKAKILESFDGTIYAVIFPRQTTGNRIGALSDSVKCRPETKIILTIHKI